MANKEVKKKLKEIPIPFQDLKNIVKELRFEDEQTRERCRGWLVLQSKKFLQVNIIFPSSDIDCRMTIRALTGDDILKQIKKPKSCIILSQSKCSESNRTSKYVMLLSNFGDENSVLTRRRNFVINWYLFARLYARAAKLCAVRMRSAILRNQLNVSSKN